jgi:cation diffusion facilitator family transporter
MSTNKNEKKNIALTSVLAAIFLTSFKLIVGLLTRSLGILSEALHSALDLVAAVVTYFAVRISDKPADYDHNFGHGKIENISALIETLLLFLTCIWIIYEAINRLVTGNMHIEITPWSYAVVIISIIIDFSRSRALHRVAKKYDSQALEADALHFKTDIWSSAVVLLGLVAASFHYQIADALAALMVAMIVLSVSYRLGKKSFDALVDKAPDGIIEQVAIIVSDIKEVFQFHDIRVREAGNTKFIELNIHVEKSLSVEQAHDIASNVEETIQQKITNSKVLVHFEPEESTVN